jgi:hypothetical protein
MTGRSAAIYSTGGDAALGEAGGDGAFKSAAATNDSVFRSNTDAVLEVGLVQPEAKPNWHVE